MVAESASDKSHSVLHSCQAWREWGAKAGKELSDPRGKRSSSLPLTCVSGRTVLLTPSPDPPCRLPSTVCFCHLGSGRARGLQHPQGQGSREGEGRDGHTLSPIHLPPSGLKAWARCPSGAGGSGWNDTGSLCPLAPLLSTSTQSLCPRELESTTRPRPPCPCKRSCRPLAQAQGGGARPFTTATVPPPVPPWSEVQVRSEEKQDRTVGGRLRGGTAFSPVASYLKSHTHSVAYGHRSSDPEPTLLRPPPPWSLQTPTTCSGGPLICCLGLQRPRAAQTQREGSINCGKHPRNQIHPFTWEMCPSVFTGSSS